MSEQLDSLREELVDRISSTDDNQILQLQKEDGTLHLMYNVSLCDPNKLYKFIRVPFAEKPSLAEFAQYIQDMAETFEASDTGSLQQKLYAGYALIFMDDQILAFKAVKDFGNQQSPSTVEGTLYGPQNAFSEDNETNVSIIRQRYPSADLIMENLTAGTTTQSKVSLLYDSAVVNMTALGHVKERMKELDAAVVQAPIQLYLLLNRQKYSLFPTMLHTDRPDRAVLNLSQGKIVLFVQGTPFAVIGPVVFYDFVSSMDDGYMNYWFSRFTVILRYLSIFFTLFLPAIYIAAVSFSPEIFRVQLTFSLAGSRAAVPYPSYVEVLIMLFMIEALTEASIRLPRLIGSTAATVGGLILGQAAQQAGLVSSILIIVISLVAISSFVIPVNPIFNAIRVIRIPLILMATLLGVTGLAAGFFVLVFWLANVRSFGQPYFRIFADERSPSGMKKGGKAS
ncbi:spore germination protein [Paenibacillus sp. GP183]|uniref:spore germination protein n=1 Tax=Paenibacillus sp. GP183 TaxID=1882751 RepID=UPI0008946DC2|nr:spore germination protein [Paenibacillus sp. GP183]SEC56194.1 spore germination protein [Paenibacillus sp. GP183]